MQRCSLLGQQRQSRDGLSAAKREVRLRIVDRRRRQLGRYPDVLDVVVLVVVVVIGVV